MRGNKQIMSYKEENRVEFNKRYKGLLNRLKLKISYTNKIHLQTTLFLIRTAYSNTDDKKILEVGGGITNVLFHFPKAKLTGFDFSEQAVQEMRRVAQKKNLTGVFTDNFEQVKNCGPFDLITCTHVLEHTPDATEFLNKYKKLLSPTGFFIIIIPINEPRSEYFRQHKMGYYFNLHLQHFSEKSLKKCLDDTDLEVIYLLKNNRIQHILDQIIHLTLLRKCVTLAFFLLPFPIYLQLDKLLANSPYRQLGVVCRLRN